MKHARTIAMATTLLADGRAEDVADMVDPLLDPVTAPAASTGQILLRGLMARVEIVHRNRPDRGFELLPEIDEVSQLCTCVRAEVALWRGWAHARRPETVDEATQGLRLLQEAQELFASINDPVGRCWTLLGRAQAYVVIDEYGLMRRTLDEAAALLDQLRDAQAERWLHELRIPALRSDGRYDEVEEHVQALYSIATEWEDRRLHGYATAYSAALHDDRGASPSTVIEQAKTAASLLQQVENCASSPLLTAFDAHVGALCRRGAWQEAEDVVATAESTLSDDPIARTHLRMLRIRIALRRGDSETASALRDDLLDRAHQLPSGLHRSRIALLYGETLFDQDRLGEAETWMRQAHRSALETGHRGTQLRTLLSLAQLAAVRGNPEVARSRLEAAQEYDDYFRLLPYACHRFVVEGIVAQAQGQSTDARQAFHLARSAAALIGDRPREVALDQILVEVEAEESLPSRPAGTYATFGTLGTDGKRNASKTQTHDAPAEPFDSSFSARLARAVPSLPLVTETWLQEVEAALPGTGWTGLCRVTNDGSSGLVHDHGSRPDGFVLPTEDQNGSPNDAIEWWQVPGQTPSTFFFGIETGDGESRPSSGQEVEAQIHSGLPVLGLALDRASAGAQPPSSPPDIDPTATVEGFVAESSEMQALVDEIRRIHPSHSPVLITGERGTGKRFVARAVHETSARADGPLERVSCAPTQTEEPLKSRLFGTVDEEGTRTPGAVHAAEGGTLVIEDIDALPLSLQSSLLHLLESGTPTPAGPAETADVRIIATTTADLDARVQEGRFRNALRNRLRGISLHVPPLRKRRADIPLLIRHFLDTLRPNRREEVVSRPRPDQLGGGSLGLRLDDSTLVSITQPAMEALLWYNWPGNVRQLRNEIERALVHVQSEPAPTIDLDILLDTIVEHAQREDSQPTRDGLDAILQPNQTLSDVLSRTEKSVIERVLRACDGQITASADVLGLTRQGLYKKMKRLDIDASAFQSSSEPAPASP